MTIYRNCPECGAEMSIAADWIPELQELIEIVVCNRCADLRNPQRTPLVAFRSKRKPRPVRATHPDP